MALKKDMIFLRTKGSPPVMRNFSTPSHIFGHAIDAAKIAAIGHRHPQVIYGAGKRVN